jgi:hypothetical protein
MLAMLFVVFIASYLLSCQAEMAPLIPLTDSKARCMDGTLSGYYFQSKFMRFIFVFSLLFVYFLFLLESTKESESTKWVIHLQGGGECASKDSCYSELSSNLGSSKYFDPSMSLWFLNYDNPSANPDFAYANHVHVPYCSGDLHSGTVRHPTEETWGLYFSGHLVFEAIVSIVAAFSLCLVFYYFSFLFPVFCP